MASVSLKGVRKCYDGVEVIHGVDCEIVDGEFIVILGPSGCGKSTLLRMIAGLEAITAGEVAIGGRIVNDLEPKDRDIAMVFQNYALYPHMTVYDNMSYGLRIRGMSKAEIEARVQKAANILELGGFSATQAAPALGRPAPARGDGPRHRARAGRVPVRRAAIESRRQAARADAYRDQAAPSEHPHHQRLRDPRPGRGDDAGGSPDRHECRPRRADRTPDRCLRTAGDHVCRRLHRLACNEHTARRGSPRTHAASSSTASVLR